MGEDVSSNVLQFKPSKSEPLIKLKEAGYRSCRHHKLTVCEETRTVRCSDCDTLLDAVDVILEAARKERRWIYDREQWEAMRDSRLSDRYDLEWEAKKDDIVAPPEDPELLGIWHTFHTVFRDKFCGMYRRKKRKTSGPLWYGRSTDGATFSYGYALSLLTPKIVT